MFWQYKHTFQSKELNVKTAYSGVFTFENVVYQMWWKLFNRPEGAEITDNSTAISFMPRL